MTCVPRERVVRKRQGPTRFSRVVLDRNTATHADRSTLVGAGVAFRRHIPAGLGDVPSGRCWRRPQLEPWNTMAHGV